MQVDFDSLGTYLRQERERQQVALQDVAESTKIQRKFLEALEHDAYDQLPAEPFVMGFLRAYAQYLALDPAMVLAAYRSLHRHAGATEVLPIPPPVSPPPPARRPFGRRGVLAVVSVIVLGFIWYEVWRSQQSSPTVTSFPAAVALPGPDTPRVANARAPVAPVPEILRGPASATPSDPLGRPELRQGFPTTAGVSEAAPLPPPVNTQATPAPTSALLLEAKAQSDTWLGIEIDGGKRLNVLLTAGKSAQWEAQERFRVTVGNTRGTHLTLNGQEMTLQASRSNVTRDLVLTRAQLR